MSTTNAQFVHQMYITYLQRPAEPAGHAFWVSELESGAVTREELAAQFGGSEEFAGRFTEANRAELINEVYQALFGRDAEAEGLAFWMSEDIDVALLPTVIAEASADWDGATLQNRLTFAEKLMASLTQEQYESVTQEQLREMLSKVTDTTEVTDAFVADVVAGAGLVDNSELTEALAKLQDSEKAVEDFLENWGAAQNPVVTTPTSTNVFAAVEAAEVAVDTAAGAIAASAFGVLHGVTLTGYNEVDTAAANNDQLEDARLAVLNVEVAALVAKAEADVNTATKTLNDLNKAGLKAAVDSYILAAANADKAGEPVVAGGALFDKATTAVAVFNAATPVTVTAPTGYVAVIDLLLDGTFTYDVATKVWTVPAALQSSPYLADLQSSVVALNAGFQAKDNADDLVDLRLKSIATIDPAQVDVPAAPNALATQAKAYADAVEDFAELNAAVEELAAAVSAVDSARADFAALAALEKTVADQEKALADAGYSVEAIVDTSIVAGSAADDIFVLSTMEAGDTATINDFGTLGNDKLFIGNEFTANSGALTDGDNSVKEVFFIQNGVNTDVIFESVDFGSNAAAAALEVFTITLTGVTAADLSLSDDGYISIA